VNPSDNVPPDIGQYCVRTIGCAVSGSVRPVESTHSM
jgi:hypothetical protein